MKNLLKLSFALGAFVLAAFALADTVPINTPLTLAVRADGTQPFTYQWFRDGVPMAGETKSTLYIKNFDSSTGGVYSCSVTNYVGSAMSNSLTLTAQIPGTAPTNVLIEQVPPPK